jgi:hypothetical protein
VADWSKDLSKMAEGLLGNWTAYVAFGSLLLYLMGYLSLHFHLTALGIGTDLSLIDQRYLLAGGKFFVYLLVTVPTIILLALVPVVAIFLPYRILLPRKVRMKIGDLLQACWARLWTKGLSPTQLSIIGIVFSVVMIQLVMRQCFVLTNLLLATHPAGPPWLWSLLLAESDASHALYFSGLVVSASMAVGLFFITRSRETQTALSRFLCGVFGLLVVIQLLMLPINHGIFIVDKTMPQVAQLGDNALQEGQEVWLVFEGTEGLTYLVRESVDGKPRQRLVTFRHKEIKKIEITGYDSILWVLFADQTKQEESKSADKKETPQ